MHPATMRHAAVPALLVILTAGCPNPRNPLGPRVDPPAAPAASIAFGLGSTGQDAVRDVAVDPSGNLYITGQFTGTVDFDPSPATVALSSLGGDDVFVARYSPTGFLTWAIRVGGPGNDAVQGIALDQAGNLVVGGSFAGTADFEPGAGVAALTSNGGQDGWVASYSTAGAFRWARGFGNAGEDVVLDVSVTTDGNVVAAGSFTGTMLVDPGQGIAVTSTGGEDGFLASWSGTGSTRWAIAVGGPGADAVQAVAAGPFGAVLVGGYFSGSADFAPGAAASALVSMGGADAFLARYTNSGALAWARGFGGALDDRVAQGGLASQPSGTVYATGEFAGVADFDASGATAGRTSNGLSDIFLVQYGPDGSFGWVVGAGGSGADVGAGVAVAGSGEVTITGAFEGNARFDSGVGFTVLRALGTGGASDLFVAQYTGTGGLRWAVGVGAPLVGGGFRSGGTAVAADGGGNVLVGGQFFGSADVDPASALAVLISLGNADGLVAKFTATGALARRP